MKKLGLHLTLAISITLLFIGIFYTYQNSLASGLQNNFKSTKDSLKNEDKLKIDNEKMREIELRVDSMEKWVSADEKNIDKWLKFLGIFLSIVIAASIYNGLRANSLAKDDLDKIRDIKKKIEEEAKGTKDSLKELKIQTKKSIIKAKKLEEELEQKIKELVVKHEKELLKKNKTEIKNLILQLRKILPITTYARSAENQWIFDDFCLVYDYKIDNYNVSIDTFLNDDGWQIQLFGRMEEDRNYLFETLGKIDNFLPMPFDEYEIKENRLIFKELPITATIEEVAESLRQLLSNIEAYKSQHLK